MKYLFFYFIFAANALFAQQETDILAIQQKRFEATTKQDSATLETLLSPDLYYIHSNGLTENKAQHLQTILQQKIVYQSFTYLDKPVILKRKKLYIINGTVLVKGLYNNTPFETKLLFTALYECKKRHWQLVRWQSTKIN
ncbi:MAG: hypothetical protein RL757_1066 [Bacteroidota bacterium]|jgi:hypothetical protein